MWRDHGTGAPWHGPRRQLAARIAAPGLIWRTDTVALALTGIDVFADLVEFAFSIWRRRTEPLPRAAAATIRSSRMLVAHGPGPLPPDVLRIGVLTADGRTATNLEQYVPRDDIDERAPGADLVLVPAGGHAGPDGEEQRLRMWPLPPPGRFEIVVEWPAYGLAETHIPVDADAVRGAAATVAPIWPDDQP